VDIRREALGPDILDYAVTAFNAREELSSEVNAEEGGRSLDGDPIASFAGSAIYVAPANTFLRTRPSEL